MISRTLPLWAAAAVASLIPLHAVQAASSVKFPDKVCKVTDYGAEGHRLQIALNTGAIQKAIDDCAAAGGGTVLVPKGNFLTNPLFLRNNIQLKLEKDATLVASTEVAAYRADEKSKYAEAENGWLPFISIATADLYYALEQRAYRWGHTDPFAELPRGDALCARCRY